MNKFLVPLAAAVALAGAAAPALAQSNSPTAYTDSFDWQINNAAQQGRISWGQARELRGELQQVKPLAWRVQTGEASGWERSRWRNTLNRIQAQINGGGGYYYGRRHYDRDNSWYGRQNSWNGRDNSWYGRERDGWR